MNRLSLIHQVHETDRRERTAESLGDILPRLLERYGIRCDASQPVDRPERSKPELELVA
jgi:hypothetical protein